MHIQYEKLALPVTKHFIEQLIKLIQQYPIKDRGHITINFRDPGYSPETGGYHPVEIRLKQQGERWHICYITDFFYVGQGAFAELTKSLDFDFEAGMFQDISGYYPIETATVIYPIWEDNFMTYWLEMGVFNVEVTAND